MNKLSILYFFAAAFTLFLGALVYIKNPKQILNRIFSLLCLSVCLWQFFYGLMLGGTGRTALYFAKMGHFAVPYIPIIYLHFVAILLKRRKIRPIYISLYILAFISSMLTISTGLCFSGLKMHTWGLYPDGKILMLIDFVVTCVTATFTLYLLMDRYYRLRKEAQNSIYLNKLKYTLFAFVIFLIGVMDYLPKLYTFTIDIIPIGNIAVIIFASINSYAILKHNLLDLNIAIRKGLIYSILVTFITIFYFIFIFLAENIFRGLIGYRSIPLALVIVILLMLLFQPLKNKIQLFVDKFFFKRTRETLVRENERLMEEIRRTDRLKSVATLAAGMAHEIKNPLTSIKTFTEYLDTKYDDKDFRDKFKRIVSSEADKINNIVGQLLDFAKPRPLSLQEMNVCNAVNYTLSLLSNDLIKRRIDIIKKYEIDPSSTIKGDHNRLEQIFLNLFLNAMDAMKTGGKLIVGIKWLSKEDFLEVTIQDTGRGISEKELEHIFDPFYSTKETGTGLGLSIVHGIIKEHGGSITCESEKNKGTKFTIILPA